MSTPRLTPDFRRQKQELLSLRALPDAPLPGSVEECLRSIGDLASPIRLKDMGIVRVWSEVFQAVRPLLIRAAGISLFASACAASSTLVAMRILGSKDRLGAMLGFSAVYLVMNSLSQVATFQSGRIRAWVSLSAESYLVGLISRKLVRLSALAAARQSSGNLKILITSDVKNIGQFLDNVVRNLIPALAALIVITPLLVHFTGRAGLVGVAVMALVLPLSLGLNQISAYFQDKSQARLDELTSLAGEWVKNIRLIRYLSWDEAFRNDVSAGLRKYMTVSAAQHFMACLIFGLSMSWWMVSVTGVVLVSRALGYPLDLVGFFGSLWLLTFLAGYLTHLPNTIRLYGQAAPSVKRIARLLVEEEQQDFLRPSAGPVATERPCRVLFERVGFQYPDGKRAIHDLTLEIDLSRKVAIVGEIASGKTTFLKLLCGELPPTQGSVRVEFEGGRTLDLWETAAHASFRRHLAYVPQEPFVSSDLLGRNISLSIEADEGETLEAAYWAELEADIAAFPQGLNQEIGESGVNLSGGQKQRLNLARAFCSRRGYLVLDDTLSAVDTRTEIILMDRLVSRAGGFVLVTHRTGELMRVEEVIVMKDGAVVERGNPRELASRPGSHFTRVLRAYEIEEAAHV